MFPNCPNLLCRGIHLALLCFFSMEWIGIRYDPGSFFESYSGRTADLSSSAKHNRRCFPPAVPLSRIQKAPLSLYFPTPIPHRLPDRKTNHRQGMRRRFCIRKRRNPVPSAYRATVEKRFHRKATCCLYPRRFLLMSQLCCCLSVLCISAEYRKRTRPHPRISCP